MSYFGHARIDVAVADVGVAGRIPGHVGHLPEHAVDRRQRRLGMLERLGAFVGGFLLASEHHHDVALGIELDHHVGALVGDPDVVVLVDAHGVRERPGVEVVADLANIFAVRAEFQKLRGAGRVGRSGGVAARENEDVSLGIDGHAGDFAEIQILSEASPALGTESNAMSGAP